MPRSTTPLRESEDVFRQLAENIREVFWLSTPETGQILYISPAYEEIWGRPRAEVYRNALTLLDTVHFEDRERLFAALPKQMTGEFDEEFRIERLDGSVRWIRARAFPIRNERGETYRIAGISEDITKRKHAESTVHQYAERLQLLSHQLVQAQEAERRQVARELHDEIGQALTATKMNLQSLRVHRHGVSGGRRIEESIAIVDRVLQQVRDLSLDLRPSLLDDLGLVAALRWYLDRQAQRARITIQFVADPFSQRL